MAFSASQGAATQKATNQPALDQGSKPGPDGAALVTGDSKCSATARPGALRPDARPVSWPGSEPKPTP